MWRRSPPTRGSVGGRSGSGRPASPLPAHAGVSRSRSGRLSVRPSAPRPRGGQSFGLVVVDLCHHRSPPTRGSVAPLPCTPQDPLPLPAHAGVSRAWRIADHPAKPAPRPRGGQSLGYSGPQAAQVRSPPTRGSVIAPPTRLGDTIPLPAHAGVSRTFWVRVRRPRPAPRPRGGQSAEIAERERRDARSPPTRGSVGRRNLRQPGIHPLPAHAGVSRRATRWSLSSTAAPRPRGGQSEHCSTAFWWLCRSPPTRGSVANRKHHYDVIDPLPAHAGVSRRLGPGCWGLWPAPRPRGGQSNGSLVALWHVLRSPPTRGSVGLCALLSRLPAPLPAHAGVSRTTGATGTQLESAPRPRGGQSTRLPTGTAPESRSPPTRGSVGCSPGSTVASAPLPAHAGVSRLLGWSGQHRGTAPRPRGGQSDHQPGHPMEFVRSPPTRGSVGFIIVMAAGLVPLPAHAGVSRVASFCASASATAPRPRGGQSLP